jgi:glycosyltransferase involved in cell wall biosynthesis
MFSAANLGDKRKGGDLLIKSLQLLPESLKHQIVLLVLGDGGERLTEALDMETICLGYASGDRLKAIAYSAADLFLFPTRADNLPLVLQEAMACGTPMVSFKVGGVPDLVRPGETGYLAAAEDTGDFATGVVELLEDSAQREAMAQHCRTVAVEEYSLELQAQRYIELYQTVFSNSKK